MSKKEQTELQKEIVDYFLNNGFTQDDERFLLNPFYWADRQDICLDERDGLFEYAPGRKIEFLDTETYVSVNRYSKITHPNESYCLEFWDGDEDEMLVSVTIYSEMEKAARMLLLERFTLAAVEQAKLSSAFVAIVNSL